MTERETETMDKITWQASTRGSEKVGAEEALIWDEAVSAFAPAFLAPFDVCVDLPTAAT